MYWDPPWGISILADSRPMGYKCISFHAVVVFGLGKNLLFKSTLGRFLLRYIKAMIYYEFIVKSFTSITFHYQLISS